MIYKLKLTPVGNYFFGTEKTFGEGSGANYSAKSSHFPQQTTLLGMLRYEMLKQNKQIPINNKLVAKELIGANSFNSRLVQSYGQIERLSPLFLQTDDEVFFISPRNKQVFYEDVSEKHIFQNLNFKLCPEKAFSFTLNQDNKVEAVERMKPVLQDFDLKTFYEDYFMSFGLTKKLLMKEVFTEHSQIGITKSYDSGTKNKAFFKKTSYNLKKGLSFACWIELNDEINWSNELVFMGAERSTFLLEVGQPETQWYDEKFDLAKKEGNAIVLLSDAYVGSQIYKECDFALTSLVDFRNFESNLSSNFGKLLPKTNLKMNLIKKGSVFYANDLGNLTEALNNNIFQRIGYNAYMTI